MNTELNRRIRGDIMIKSKVGLWIDHRRAIVVTVTEEGEEMTLTVSGVEKQPRRAGTSPFKGHESRQIQPDDRRKRSFDGHLNRYYDAVIASIGDASSVLVFGPGVAKGELKNRLAKCKCGARIASFETADKMTNRQIAAKVRQGFVA